MEVWITFLFVAFLSGARLARKDRRERVIWLVIASTMVAGVFMFERYA